MPLRIPSRTNACRTGSRCRGGRMLRAASAFADTGRAFACSAMSTTAVIARRPLRDNRDIEGPVQKETILVISYRVRQVHAQLDAWRLAARIGRILLPGNARELTVPTAYY